MCHRKDVCINVRMFIKPLSEAVSFHLLSFVTGTAFALDERVC